MQPPDATDQVRNGQENALRDVLNIEREAQAIIADAATRAEHIVSSARERAREAQARAEFEARADADEDIATALRYAEQSKRVIQGRVEKESAEWEALTSTRIDAVIDWVVRVVTMSEDGGDAPRN